MIKSASITDRGHPRCGPASRPLRQSAYMQYWKTLTHREQEERISAALRQNIDYTNKISLGLPASKLDQYVFYEHASFIKDAPLLRTYVQNPNHIGCHTLGHSEPFFEGTQALEREVIELLATDVFKARPGSCDGYIASGGTEANIQAAWIYRNYFMREHNATHGQIGLLCSEDTHYSVIKAGNLLGLHVITIPVYAGSRVINEKELEQMLVESGKDYFIVFCNMGTTMFGSVDDPDTYATVLNRHSIPFRLHVDGAYGGFIYPISAPHSHLNFDNPVVSSVTLDAHKMLQAPYGTGIFLARKGLMQYTYTKEASYVSGMDMTLIGSRGGVNAIAIWMILFTYGPFGWLEKINKLLFRTGWLCERLAEKEIVYYRHPSMNIVTIKAGQLAPEIIAKYGLVPNDHSQPSWHKIVVMEHVSIDHLQSFIDEL